MNSSPSRLSHVAAPRAALEDLLLLRLAQSLIKHLMQQRRFARPRDSRDRHQHSQRNADVDTLQIVRPHAPDLDLLRSRLPPHRRNLNAQIFRQDNGP